MATRMQQRRGTAAQWTEANPILAVAEIGFESDTGKFKMGDGVNHWSALTYFTDSSDFDASSIQSSIATAVSNAVDNLVDGAPAALDTLNEIATLIGDGSSLAGTLISNIAGLDTTVTELGAGLVSVQADVTALTGDVTNGLAAANTDIDANTVAISNVQDNLDTHAADQTNIHGIANTADLATKSYADDKADTARDSAISTAGTALEGHTNATTSVHGISDTANLVYTSDSRLSDERTPSAGSVTAAKIATDAVETSKIADNAVTNAKLADDAVDTAEIKDNAVTNAKLAGSIAQSKITNLESDLAGKQAVVSGVSDTEIGYLDGVTSAIQTQIDSKAPIASPTFTGTVNTGDLVITGDLTVSGTTTTVSTTNFTTSDPVIYLGEGNNANLVDLGFVASYNDGTYAHQGLVKDTSDGKWKLFKGVTDEPTTTVNFAQGSMDALKVGAFEATTVTPSSGIVFSDGTQVKVGVPSITEIGSTRSSSETLTTGEQDKFVPISGAVTITLPSSGYLIGQSIDFWQSSGTGAQFAGTGVVGTPGLKLRTTYSVATAMKIDGGWLVFGDLSA